VNQRGEIVITGSAEVIAPTEKISRPRIILPEVELREKGRFHRKLVEMTQGLTPVRTAVVHPVDTVSLLGAIEAAREQLIVPLLIGPKAKICAAAAQAQLDISPYELISTEHSEAAAALSVASGQGRGADERRAYTRNSCTRWSMPIKACARHEGSAMFSSSTPWLSEATLGHGCGDQCFSHTR
jgi:hypothetical protein